MIHLKSKHKNPFTRLSKGERLLWVVSLFGVASSYFLSLLISGKGNLLSTIASLLGVTSLIFIAKGMVFGQVLMILFALLYGIVSLSQKYYGEMLTYVFMSAPMALFSIISWLRHPFRNEGTVKIARLTKKSICILACLAVLVTVVFYYLLRFFGNANLTVSTISVTTSFIAASLTFLRSPYYALGYVANDAVLIVLWTLSSINDLSYLPMLVCFLLFLVNDFYGFLSWRRMQKYQNSISIS